MNSCVRNKLVDHIVKMWVCVFIQNIPNLFHDFFSYNVKLLFFSDTQEHYGIDQKNWNIFRQIPVESNSTKEKPLEKDLMKWKAKKN